MRLFLSLCFAVALTACAPGERNYRNPATKRDISEFDTLVVLGHVYGAAWSDIELHSREGDVVDDAYLGERVGDALQMQTAAPVALALIPLDYLARSVVHSATSTPHSQGEISQATRDFERHFQPKRFRKTFETSLAAELRSLTRDKAGLCVRAMQNTSRCSRSAKSILLFAEAAVEPFSDQHGNIEALTRVTALVEPKGLLQPVCLSWRFRSPIGNIFDPSQSGASEIDSALRRTMQQIAAETAQGISAIARGGARASVARVACDSSIYRINSELAVDLLEELR